MLRWFMFIGTLLIYQMVSVFSLVGTSIVAFMAWSMGYQMLQVLLPHIAKEEN